MGMTFSTIIEAADVEESKDGKPKILWKVRHQREDSDTLKSEEARKKATADSSGAKVPSFKETEESVEDYLFPAYLKSEGPCKDKFVKLEKCVEDADKNDKWMQKGFCFVKGLAMLRCVNETHEDYYEELDKRMNANANPREGRGFS